MYQSKISNSFPIVWHAPGLQSHDGKPKCWTSRPGKRNGLWPELRDYALKLKIAPTPDLDVITFNSKDIKSPLEFILEKSNQSHVVLGKGISNWQHSFKHRLSFDYISSSKAKYIMALDAFDVVYTGNLQLAIDYLLSLNKKNMLFNSDWGWWPANTPHHLKKYEEVRATSRFKFLNAGVWIAKKEAALSFLEKAVEMSKTMTSGSEQYIYHHLYKEVPNLAIDYKCAIFQTDINWHNIRFIPDPEPLSRIEEVRKQRCS